MSLQIKICGLSTLDTLEAALAAGADMLGFVFFAASPRHIGFETARELGQRAAGRARKVALFVDADDETLTSGIAALRPDLLQLHGQESPERVAIIKMRFGLPVMKVIAVETRSDLDAVATYLPVADRLLFDARPSADADRPGGLGKSFDWRLLQGLEPGIPYMVSGGLNAENVAAALRISGAPGIDVSSGVERAVGQKDPDKIRDFIAAARAADAVSVAGDGAKQPVGYAGR